MNAAEISRTGMDVEWRRLEVIAQNIANAQSVTTAGGQPFRAMRLISGPKKLFQKLMTQSDLTREPGVAPGGLNGVAVYGLEAIDAPPRLAYEPGSPQADSRGYVTYPGFDQAAEMALMLKTARTYEANVVALNLARQMYLKAMEIGR